MTTIAKRSLVDHWWRLLSVMPTGVARRGTVVVALLLVRVWPTHQALVVHGVAFIVGGAMMLVWRTRASARWVAMIGFHRGHARVSVMHRTAIAVLMMPNRRLSPADVGTVVVQHRSGVDWRPTATTATEAAVTRAGLTSVVDEVLPVATSTVGVMVGRV